MNSSIFLNASDIASICERHPYQKVHNTFTKLLNKLSDDEFETKDDQINSIIESIDESKSISNLIKEAVSCKNITDVNTKVKQIESVVPKSTIPEVNTLLTLIDNVISTNSPEDAKDNMNNIKVIASKMDIPEVNVALNMVNKPTSKGNIADLKKSATQIKSSIPSNKIISVNDRQDIVKSIESKMNCGFGTNQEKSAIKKYETEHNTLIGKRNDKLYKKKITSIDSYSIIVGGKVDGIKEDGTVIEVKNRMHKFFTPLPKYDIIQLQTYLYILNSSKGELVEQLKSNKNSIKSTPIDFDLNMWNNMIEPSIIRFVTLLIKVLNDQELQNEYKNSCDFNKQRFVDQSL